MSTRNETHNMAVFCDFENVALGVRESKDGEFDIARVLERLLLKGSIVVKKAYCDWERYKAFKARMHQASFELIEIPHVSQSGKNSADIRMVVDALDLCYTKAHVDTFVIISGDSDFSPLVSKLRENAKTVIGVGVRQSTSDLLMKNCDEFIYYDVLAPRVAPPTSPKPSAKRTPAAAKRGARKPAATAVEEVAAPAPAEHDPRHEEAFGLVLETIAALQAERGEEEKLWGSMIKQTLKRRQPGFNEGHYGFDSFNKLLEEAQRSNRLKLQRDEKSGGYTVKLVGG